MNMGVEKRKSNQNMGTPAKQVKSNQNSPNKFGKSPQTPGGGGGKFDKSPGKFGGKQQGGSPGGKSQGFNKQEGKKWNKGGPGPKGQQEKAVPPPPPAGAKKLEIQTVKSNAKPQKKNFKQQQKNGSLNKVSDESKAIKKTAKKNRFQRLYTKLDQKKRTPADCARAHKAEQDLVQSGRAFSVKIADPPITQEVVKGWSAAIETAVFTRPVEPRQFLVVFKHNANVKKEIENLKKTTFAGGKITVEEKMVKEQANADAIDPFTLYVSNLHETVTKESLLALFPKSETICPPRKHNPKLGSATKFSFITFASSDDALASFKENYQAVLSGNSIVMRFRRVAAKELHNVAKEDAAEAAVVPTPKSAGPKIPAASKKTNVKVEPQSDGDDEDDDDSEGDGELLGAEEAGSDDEDDDEDEDDDDDDDEDDEDDDE